MGNGRLVKISIYLDNVFYYTPHWIQVRLDANFNCFLMGKLDNWVSGSISFAGRLYPVLFFRFAAWKIWNVFQVPC